LLPPEEGREHVKKYGAIALANTPVENPQVYTILARLGHDSGMPGLSGKSPMAELLSRKLVQD